MATPDSAPLLSKVKSWQLVGFGISGWITFYSMALISWGASSAIIGHTQGGFFAATMTLAGVEASRLKKGGQIPTDPLQWASEITTEQVNQSIMQVMQAQDFRVELPHPVETEMGIGLRAVNAGRTMVFETGRWKEPVIDLPHAKAAEETRMKLSVDIAVIVSAGKPDQDTQVFVKTHPVQLLTGQELKTMLGADKSPDQPA